MKKLVMVLAFLVCFITVNGFCGAARQDRFVPLTDDLINRIVDEYGGNLRDLGYYLSAPLTMTTKDDGRTGRIDAFGRFIVTERKKAKEYRITNLDKGELDPRTPVGRNSFTVEFLGRFTLVFESSAQNTGFILVSATDKNDEYEYIENADNPTPYLRIYYKYNVRNRNELLASTTAAPEDIKPVVQQPEPPVIENSAPKEEPVPPNNESSLLEGLLAAKNDNNRLLNELLAAQTEAARLNKELLAAKKESVQPVVQPERPVPIPPQPQNPILVPIPPASPGVAANARRNIEGSGSLAKSNIVGYIHSINPGAARGDVEALIDAYIREARWENINYDIAVAQMCYATNYLRDRQLMNDHNYGAFAAINGVPVRYANMNEGIRAHIQHLKGYASRERPQWNIVDKRYQTLVTDNILGTVKTLDALFRVWAPKDQQNYGNRINKILEDLYRIPGM